jgi:hypothetical protein
MESASSRKREGFARDDSAQGLEPLLGLIKVIRVQNDQGWLSSGLPEIFPANTRKVWHGFIKVLRVHVLACPGRLLHQQYLSTAACTRLRRDAQ